MKEVKQLIKTKKKNQRLISFLILAFIGITIIYLKLNNDNIVNKEQAKKLELENDILIKENRLLLQSLHINNSNKNELYKENQILKTHLEKDEVYILSLKKELKRVSKQYNNLPDDSIVNIALRRYEKDTNTNTNINNN